MKIAILGTGPIGSTFAFHLARSGHEVTVIARNKRLEQLQAENAIVTIDDQRAAVTVHPTLDPAIPFDLVLVTVLASQVDVVLPALRTSVASTIMFMFNTFESLDRLRDAVGEKRFAFGFPAILATLPEGKLKSFVVTRGQTTITTDARWAKVFSDAGIPTVVQDNMQSWLRTHAVLVVPVMSMSTVVHARQSGISWAEAKAYTRALQEGFDLVQHVGSEITPSAMSVFDYAPTFLVTGLWWTLSRSKLVRDLGAIGPSEPRALVDAMIAAAPERCAHLQAIRP